MIRIVQGSGRYADPWHPFVESSAALARVLRHRGATEVVEVSPRAISDLEGVDLLVVNTGCGDPQNPPEPDGVWAPAHRRLHDWMVAGGPVLVVHTGAASFTDSPWWADDLGGQWVRGQSMHPPMDQVGFSVVGDHPIVAGLSDHLDVRDERYSFMDVHQGSVPLLAHGHDGREQVMAWARESAGLRVVYDGMGHDAASYEQPDRVAFLLASAGWLL